MDLRLDRIDQTNVRINKESCQQARPHYEEKSNVLEMALW